MWESGVDGKKMRRNESRKNRITVVMGNQLKDRVESLAVTNERSVSDFIRLVLKEYVEAIEEAEEESAQASTDSD